MLLQWNHQIFTADNNEGIIHKSTYNDKKKYTKMIERVRDFSCSNLSVENKSFDEVIPNFPNDMIYLDPPYYMKKDSDNKMFKGIYPNSNFAVHHNEFDHEKLRDLLHNHKGDFILSYNDCETIREYYKDFKLSYPQWHSSYAYNFDKSKNTERNSKESHEILICKFSIDS